MPSMLVMSTNPEPEAQYFYIHFPWGGCGTGVNYCPMCGAPLYEEEGCPHRLFLYFDESGEFEFVAEEIQPLVDQILEEQDDDDDELGSLPQMLTSRIRRTGVICLHTSPDSTGGGMAVGLDLTISEDGVDD